MCGAPGRPENRKRPACRAGLSCSFALLYEGVVAAAASGTTGASAALPGCAATLARTSAAGSTRSAHSLEQGFQQLLDLLATASALLTAAGLSLLGSTGPTSATQGSHHIFRDSHSSVQDSTNSVHFAHTPQIYFVSLTSLYGPQEGRKPAKVLPRSEKCKFHVNGCEPVVAACSAFELAQSLMDLLQFAKGTP